MVEPAQVLGRERGALRCSAQQTQSWRRRTARAATRHGSKRVMEEVLKGETGRLSLHGRAINAGICATRLLSARGGRRRAVHVSRSVTLQRHLSRHTGATMGRMARRHEVARGVCHGGERSGHKQKIQRSDREIAFEAKWRSCSGRPSHTAWVQLLVQTVGNTPPILGMTGTPRRRVVLGSLQLS